MYLFLSFYLLGNPTLLDLCVFAVKLGPLSLISPLKGTPLHRDSSRLLFSIAQNGLCALSASSLRRPVWSPPSLTLLEGSGCQGHYPQEGSG